MDSCNSYLIVMAGIGKKIADIYGVSPITARRWSMA